MPAKVLVNRTRPAVDNKGKQIGPAGNRQPAPPSTERNAALRSARCLPITAVSPANTVAASDNAGPETAQGPSQSSKRSAGKDWRARNRA